MMTNFLYSPAKISKKQNYHSTYFTFKLCKLFYFLSFSNIL